jgi:hypothetical protein
MDATGTLGSSTSQLALKKILAENKDPKVTNAVTSRFLRAKDHLKRLKKHLRTQDIAFYGSMLSLLQQHHLGAVDNMKGKIPDIVHSHLRCCVVGVFRDAHRDVEEDLKENIRRRQRGQQKL